MTDHITDHITLPRAVVEQALAALEAMIGWQSLAPITEQENAKTQAADLRAALAAPQAEAVAVAWQRRDKWVESGEWDFWRDDFDPDEELDPEWAERRPLYAAPQPQSVPPGYKLVPVEPTDPMVQAAYRLDLSYMPGQEGADRAAIYSAMLAAAPDLRPKAEPDQPAPAEKPADHQLEHLVKVGWRYRQRNDLQWQFTEREDVACHPVNEWEPVFVAQKLKGGA